MNLRNDSAFKKDYYEDIHTYISIYRHSHSILLIVKVSGEVGQSRSTNAIT